MRHLVGVLLIIFLSSAHVPIQHRLLIDTGLQRREKLTKGVEIIFRCTKDGINSITFDSHYIIDIQKPSVRIYELFSTKMNIELPWASHGIDVVNCTRQKNSVTINFPQPCTPNGIYSVYTNFKTEPNLEIARNYLMYQTSDAGIKRYIEFISPGLHEFWKVVPVFKSHPSVRTPFTIVLQYKKNGAFFNTPNRNGDALKAQFESTSRIPPHLVVFGSTDFPELTVNVRIGLTLRVLYNKVEYEEINTFVLKLASTINYFERIFQLQIPSSNLTVILSPVKTLMPLGWSGTVVIHHKNALWSYSPLDEERLNRMAAHLAAKLWFGGLVMPHRFNDQWLFSGLAIYHQFLGAASQHSLDRDMDDRFVVGPLHIALSVDDSLKVWPLVMPKEVHNLDFFVFSKAAALIRMLRHIIGPDRFLVTIAKYIRNSMMHAVDIGSFIGFIGSEIKKMGYMFIDWLMKPGYPLLYVEKSTLTTFYFHQKPWPTEGLKKPDDRLWHIPITYTLKSSQDWQPKVIQWLHTKELTLHDQLTPFGDWYLFNVRQIGYFRVTYHIQNWNALVEQLLTNHTLIQPVNRAQIIDDLFELAKVNEVPYDLTLRAMLYLQNETKLVPLRAFISNIAKLERTMASGKHYPKLWVYEREILIPIYHKTVSWWNQTNKSDEERVVEELVATAACNLWHSHCVAQSRAYFRRANPSSIYTSIPPHLTLAVYCTAVRADKTNYTINFLIKSMETPNKFQRLIAVGGLACASSLPQLRSIFDVLFLPEYKNDFTYFIEYISKFRIGQEFMLQLRNEGIDFFQRLTDEKIPKILMTFVESRIWDYHRDEVTLLLAGTAYEFAIDRLNQRIDENVRWNNAHENSVGDFLVKFVKQKNQANNT